MRTSTMIAVVLGLVGIAGAARAQGLPTPPSLGKRAHEATYFDIHNQMVMHAFLTFATVAEPEEAANKIDTQRERDRMQLFGGEINEKQAGFGVALFGAVTVMTAHAPAPVRAIFDGAVHVGPAVFDGGGMGAGLGGRFL